MKKRIEEFDVGDIVSWHRYEYEVLPDYGLRILSSGDIHKNQRWGPVFTLVSKGKRTPKKKKFCDFLKETEGKYAVT